MKTNSAENFEALYHLIPADRVIGLISPVELELPASWKQVYLMSGLQMVFEGSSVNTAPNEAIAPLGDEHVPAMLELTKLTNPGPFLERTIDLGHYSGFIKGGRLAAMAGQRLHPTGYAEISAVCTHPDHIGKGLAKQLLLNQISRIQAAGETPFLHVRYDNDRAIKVYHDLGFTKRTDIHFTFIRKV